MELICVLCSLLWWWMALTWYCLSNQPIPTMCDLSLGNSHWASTIFTWRVSFIVVNLPFHRAVVTVPLIWNRFKSLKHHALSRWNYTKSNYFKTGNCWNLPCGMVQWSTGWWQCPRSLNHSTDALQWTAWPSLLGAQSHDWRPRPRQVLPFSSLQNFLPLLTHYISKLERETRQANTDTSSVSCPGVDW